MLGSNYKLFITTNRQKIAFRFFDIKQIAGIGKDKLFLLPNKFILEHFSCEFESHGILPRQKSILEKIAKH